MVDKDASDIDTTARAQVATLARSYAEHLARTLEAVDQAILHVRFEWRLSDGKLLLENASEAGLFPPTSLFFVAIVDRDGTIVTSTIPDTENINVADQAYFRVHKETDQDTLYFGAPNYAKGVNGNILQFSRRITTPDGRFNGVILAALAPSYLTANYDETTLKRHGLLGIVGADRNVRVMRTGSQVHSSTAPALAAVPTFTTKGGSELFDGERWFNDKRSRYLGWQTVPGYPIIALTGLDRIQVLEPHVFFRQSLLNAARTAAGLLAILTCIAIAFSLRLAWRKRELETTRAAYRMATEEGNAGFYIVREVINRLSQRQEFELIDCNAQGGNFFRSRRNQLIGTTISRNKIGAALPGLLDLMKTAQLVGVAEAELQVESSALIAATWLQVKVARIGEEYAITLYDISESKLHLAELERRSNEDPLTGLPNRRWVQAFLAKAVEEARKTGDQLAVLHVDLDGFKAVNDRLGHAGGDALLRNATQRLTGAIRPQDHIARLGGDEFVIVLERLGHDSDAAFVAGRINAAFQEEFTLSDDGRHALGASIGISLFPRDGEDAETLLKHADIAMYSVKMSCKGRFGFFDPRFYDALMVRLHMESDLRSAIEHDQFVMYYQPRVDISTGMISSMESLVRWQHPMKGLIQPNEFVPLAEENGLVVGMGTLIIDKVCAQMARWKATGQPLVPVSINVSPRQFTETDVPGLFAAALKRYQLDASLIEIEVTESSMMGETDQISAALGQLQKMGIKLLVDDFGTGYSSLSQLQRMDFDGVKVDRAFTTQIDRSEEGNVFVKAIITMAHALGMKVVAEGVENERQISMLKALECDEIQGFFISRPLPPIERQPVLPKYEFQSAA